MNNSFGYGWDVMKKNFLILLLVVIVVGLVTGPTQSFRWNMNHGHPLELGLRWVGVCMIWDGCALGMIGMVLGLLALAWGLLVVPVFKYGGKMMFLQAVREIRPDFNMLVRGFKQNYLGIVLANLLTVALVMLGFIMLVIPGIIIACRLAFVGFLVMDKGLDPINCRGGKLENDPWLWLDNFLDGLSIVLYLHCRFVCLVCRSITGCILDRQFVCHAVQ